VTLPNFSNNRRFSWKNRKWTGHFGSKNWFYIFENRWSRFWFFNFAGTDGQEGYIYIYIPYPYHQVLKKREGGAQHWLEVSTEYSKTWKATEKLQNVNTSWIHYYLCTKRGKLILLNIEYWICWKYWILNILKMLRIFNI